MERNITLGPGESWTRDVPFTWRKEGVFGVRVNVFRSLAPPDLLAWRQYGRLISVATGASDLELSVSAPDDVEPGDDLTYAVSVHNMGRATASDVKVQMSLTRGATFSSASGDDSVDCSGGPTVTCDFGEVDGAETETVEVTVNVPTDASGLIVNTALVSMDTEKSTDTNRRNNRARAATVVKTAPPSTDRAALVALYDSTDGPNWTDSANWLSEEPLEEWYGVTTDETGRVTAIDLRENRLDGQIPPEVGNLANLQVLKLEHSELTGPIPPQLGDLANLQELQLDHNQLTGSIPPQLLDLANLSVLELDQNRLMGSIPPRLGDVANLQVLELSGNQLSGPIPPELGNLTMLERLHLYDNQLTGPIPPELGGLLNLTELFLRGNQLDGPIPTQLGGLSKLEELSLTDNQLSGSIPSELVNLSELEVLFLPGNNLTGPIPSELGNLSNLEWLWLNQNNLSGPIPSELGNLSNLRWLNLRQNQLSGQIPSELGNLSNLEHLRLWANLLSGPIPAELGDLSRLQTLYLSHNQLSGMIPAELGNLSNLETLLLEGNQLTGCIPERLKDVPNTDLVRLGLPFCDSDSEAQTSKPNAMPTPAPQPSVPTPTPAPQPPIADAGSDQYVQPGDRITLDGSGSSSDATYSWWLGGMQIEGGDRCPEPCYIWDVVNLSNPSGGTTTFTAPELRNGIIRLGLWFRLRVTRGDLSDEDSVTIFVNWGN